ncbi:hypothetical protein U1701_16180 [Sphingomonas sp. PB2P19]|uniref:hypothetical protein n=1 Tax=Sphingomonas rhamnosi TaxID=3096156 RepID=UPI002FC64AD2
MNDDAGDPSEQMIRRARKVAVGLADVGLTQAEEMLRRVSPEGRAQARREREARARRHKRLFMRLLMVWLASVLLWVTLGLIAPFAVATLASGATLLLLTMLIVTRAEPRAPGREALVGAPLQGLSVEAATWLAAQRRGLPPRALHLTDSLTRRLHDLAPQLARIDPRDPTADSVRKLLATELPSLLDSWRAVPISLRDVAQANDRTPTAQLVDGLQLIDTEVLRMTHALARDALDDVATQGRYLELKYRAGDAI